MVGSYAHPEAKYGRNGDSMMAHVTPGEAVIPKEVLADPAVAYALVRAIRGAGADPSRYIVGGNNSINPHTGHPEFFGFGGIGHLFHRYILQKECACQANELPHRQP